MIISHKLKVIYIKLIKVAGTSFELALSKYCGPDDILTPIKGGGRKYRESEGFLKAQNYMDPETQKPRFVNHTPAKEIKRLVPTHIWNDYLKIATIRCPYDMLISGYYFFPNKEKRVKKGFFEKYLAKNNQEFRAIYGLHEDGKILADFLIRYEHLDEDIKELESRIDCPGLLKTFQSITAKKNKRPKENTSSCEIYSKYPNTKLIIDQRCSKLAEEYEFFQKYWPMYKSKLEKDIEENKVTQNK